MIELRGKHNTAKVYTDNVDNSTIGQITSLLNQKSIEDIKIRIMSDCHALSNIGDTVEVVEIIKPIYNFKAGGE
jgi:hypothetical protein